MLVLVRRGLFQIDDEGFLAVFCAGCHLEHTHTEPEGMIDGRHPAGISTGKVIVHGHQVGAALGEGIQVKRQGGDEGLTFAGTHLSNLALVQGNRADKLGIKGALPVGTLAGFAYSCECLRQQLIEGLPIRQAVAELGCFGE